MADKQLDNEKFEELCAGYVLQALDEDERREFEQMLEKASDEERIFYQEMKVSANQLAFSVEKNKPTDAVKDRLMTQVRSQIAIDQPASDVSTDVDKRAEISEEDGAFNWPAFTAAASFALLIICLSLIFYALNLNSEISNKEDVISQQQTKITELESEVEQKEELLAILEARELDMVLMSGMEVNPDGFGKIIWNPVKQQALLQVSNLPMVPEGKNYQLWIIRNNKPVSAGVFSVRNEGDRFFKIEEIVEADKQSADTFAVTMEPEGGMPRPTGDTYLMGSMEED